MPEIGVPAIKEGDLLAGKYRVERVLGVGGMGIVVAARHEQLDQLVAIKLVRDKALGKNEEAVTRFLREARAAVKLRSAHVAKVLDVGTLESGAPYMVMEYLEGADLGALLTVQGPLSVEVASVYVLQACEAVAEAHAAGIVHRDLKPQNLFLTTTVNGAACVKVLDFGVSKTLVNSGDGGLTQTRSMLGSPLYMSPEQMRSSRDVDARSDVWALGAVLFELLTQRCPFEAETMPELCLKVTTSAPQSLAELRPDVPQAMVDIVTRCLTKDPTQRFANAAELALALAPLVPPESRILFERAHLTNSRGKMVSVPVIATGEPFAQTAPTPAAWDSGKRSGAGLEAKGGGAMWIGGGIAVAAVVAGAVFLLRGRDPAPAPLVTSSPAQAAAVLPPPAGTTTAGGVPVPSTLDIPPHESPPEPSTAAPPLPTRGNAFALPVHGPPQGRAGTAHVVASAAPSATPVASATTTRPNIKVLDDGDSP
jgi:hypothetical protein